MKLIQPQTLDEWNQLGADGLPGYMGIEILCVEPDRLEARMSAEEKFSAPNGYLHGGAVVTLADTACGYATINNLPEGAQGFTTIELKTNFIGSTLSGDIVCVARPLHRGRSTQVWNAEVVVKDTNKTIASFTCTQMVLWPR